MEGERSYIEGRYCSVCGRRISLSDGDRYTCNNCKKEENKIGPYHYFDSVYAKLWHQYVK